MKVDVKTIIIVILIGIIGVISGFMLGNRKSGDNNSVAAANNSVADPKVAKDYKRNEIMKVIRENAKEIQKCYLDHLKNNPPVKEGIVRFIMNLREDGSVESSKITKSDFESEEIGSCSLSIVNKLYFSPPPLGINRTIGHELAFKSEETARMEAEEARKKNALPKVLPVSPNQK